MSENRIVLPSGCDLLYLVLFSFIKQKLWSISFLDVCFYSFFNVITIINFVLKQFGRKVWRHMQAHTVKAIKINENLIDKFTIWEGPSLLKLLG